MQSLNTALIGEAIVLCGEGVADSRTAPWSMTTSPPGFRLSSRNGY